MPNTINFLNNAGLIKNFVPQFCYIVQPYHLLWLTGFFFFIIVLLIICVSVYLNSRKKKQSIKQRLKLQYSEIIGQLITADTKEQLQEIVLARRNGLQQWLKHPLARKVFIDELFRASKMISGDAAENIVWAYNHFKLEADTEKKLQGKEWNTVAKAIQRLAALNQTQSIARIYRFTNSSNNHIREQAQAAVVKLTGFEGLRFLDITNRPIEKWQQLCLLHELSFHTGYDEAQIKKWLRSNNTSVVAFALMLVQTYQCHALHDYVMHCMGHENTAVKEQAIITLKEIADGNTASMLINYFSACGPDIQLQILHAMETTGTENETAFLEMMLRHSDNLFKLAAARALKGVRQNGLAHMQEQSAFLENPWPQILAQLEEECV